MSTETNVAQDQIKAYVDRILRMKEEAKAINADIREIYAEAKGNGFDKTVLGKLVGYVEKRQTDAATLAEHDALFDLYLTAFDGASGKVGTKRATHTHASEDAGITPETVRLLNTVADGMQTQAGRDALVAALDVMIEAEEVTEPQPPQPAGSDLTQDPPANNGGQVADIPAAVETSRSTQVDDVGGSGEAIPVDAKYADPGVVVWESAPPEGVVRHEYSAAFGELGQDLAVIEDDLANAKAQPIVKMGNRILDGWARYMKARSMVGLDGKGIEYPVVQYDGRDPLLDCIRWNLAGRILTDAQKRTIAERLSKLYPQRRGIIFAEFEMGMELVS